MSTPEADKVFAGSVPKVYETYLVPLIFEPYAVDLVSRLGSRPLSRVLEIAAGTGVVTRALASTLPKDTGIVATDLNQPMIDHAAALVHLYKITVIRRGARELAHTVSASCDRVHSALEALANSKPVHPHGVEINRLENEADRIYQAAVQGLFESETDPIMIIKWKELYDVLEEITDCCEDVANVIEGVVVKHG